MRILLEVVAIIIKNTIYHSEKHYKIKELVIACLIMCNINIYNNYYSFKCFTFGK
jgi:hypothetical protein